VERFINNKRINNDFMTMNQMDSENIKTTVTVPEKIFNALRSYIAINNITASDQGKVTEEALIELFKNEGIPIDNDPGKFTYSLKSEKIKKMNISISANILRALQVYIAYKGLTQHHQSRVAIVALREFLEKRGISIDDKNPTDIIFDVNTESFVPAETTR
jgi:hypothetical protein